MAGNNTIGTGAVVLTANADGLAAGLAKAEKDVESWGARVGAGLAGAFGAVAGIGAGVGAAVVATFDKAVERIDELGKVGKRADVLGVSASALMGMDELFKKVGVEAGQADAVFAKMGKSIRDVGETAKAFARAQEQAAGKGLDAATALEAQFEAKARITTLGKMGIKVADLEGKALTEQFKVIADGINRLPRGYEQAAAAMDIFGRSGAQLLPMLQRGSKGIEEFIARQRKSGQVLTDSQLRAAFDASKAWKEAKKEVAETWEGFENQLAMIAVPLVKELAEKGKGMVEDWLVPAAGYAADFSKGFVDALDAMRKMKAEGGGSGAADGGGSSFFKGKHGEKGLLDYLPKAGEVGPAIVTTLTGLGDAFTNAYRESDRYNLAKLFNPSKYGSFGTRTAPESKLTERFLHELNKPPPPPPPPPTGVISGWLARVHQTEAVVGQFREMRDIGADLFRQTPLGPFGGFLARQAGAAGEAWTRIAGNLDKAHNPFRDGQPAGPTRFAAAVERGSREAYSLELRNQYRDAGGAGGTTPQKEAVKQLERLNRDIGPIRGMIDKLLGIAETVEVI